MGEVYSPLPGVSVLVVDDDPDTRRLLREVLQYCGALVTVAASVASALKTLDRIKPDVLISDIALPQRNGYALLSALRSLPPERGGRIPALAITAYGDEHDHARALRAGFQAHMRKPLDLKRLCETVGKLAAGFQPDPFGRIP